MAFASITYTSASGTTFALTNSDGNAIEYLRQNDISVTVNGTLQTVTTDYTFNAAGTSIVLNSAVTNATVVLSRTTSIADATVSFTPGSTLTAADLNNSDKQNRFSLQEFSDSFGGLSSGTGDLSALAGFIGGSETWTSDDAHAATTAGIDARVDAKIDTALTTDVAAGDGVTVTDDSPGAGQITIGLDADIATLRDMQTGAATQLAALTSDELAILDNATVTTAELNQLSGNTLTNTFNSGETDEFPSSNAINGYVVGLMNALGGFVAIDDDQSFPETNPDPEDNAGTVVSIANAGGLVIDANGTSTTGRTITTDATVTITGFPDVMDSTTVQDGLGLQVQTTTTLNTYTYHKLIAREDDIIQLSQDINDFNNRYRVVDADPTNDNDEGDLIFRTDLNRLRVFDGSNYVNGVATNASDITNVAAGNIVATNVQDAIDELDTDKLANNVSATDRVLGRSTAGAGAVEEIICTSAGRNLLDDADAAAQRTTLGLVIGTDVQAFDANNAVTDAAQTFTEPQRGTITAVTVAAGDTTEALDFENGTNNWALTLNNTASCELSNPTNLANCVGQSGSIFVIQDGTGSRVLTYASSWDFIGGTPPTLSTAANAVDRIDYVVRSGTSIHAVFTANYS